MSRARIVKAIAKSLKRAPKKKRAPKASRKKQTQVAPVRYSKMPPRDGSIEKMSQDMVGALHRGFARAYQSPSARLQRGAKAYADRRVQAGMAREASARRRGLTTKSRLYPAQVQRLSHPNSPNTWTRNYNAAMKNPRLFREPLPNTRRAPRRRRRK